MITLIEYFRNRAILIIIIEKGELKINIHFKVNMQPHESYWFSKNHLNSYTEKNINELLEDMNKLAYEKAVRNITKIGAHFKLKKSEIKKLVRNLDKEDFGDYSLENEDGTWGIFNNFYRLVIDENVKGLKILSNNVYFNEFKVKCMIMLDGNYDIIDVKIFGIKDVDKSRNKEVNFELFFDKYFELIKVKYTMNDYIKNLTRAKETLKSDSLLNLDTELNNIKVFFLKYTVVKKTK